MRFYCSFLCKTIKTLMTYRFNAFFKLLNALIFMVVQVTIWQVVYRNGGNTAMSSYASEQHMVTYTIISHVIYNVIQSTPINSINNKFKNGDISLFLTKPCNFITYVFVENLSNSVTAFLFTSLPLIIVGSLVYGLVVPPALNIVFFIIAVFNAYITFFLLTLLCGLLSCWVIQTGPIGAALSGVIKIFSGVWIPLWLFGDFYSKLISLLPFQNIYYIPIQIFTQGIPDNQLIYQQFVVQITWIIILLITNEVIWHKGERRIMVQGG